MADGAERPEVVTIRGLAAMLGTSTQRADQLSRTKGFPDHLPSRDRTRVWLVSDVDAWIAVHRPDQQQPPAGS